MSIFQEDGFRTIDLNLSNTIIDLLKREWKNYIKYISPYPGNFKGKGIVICAGCIKYFTCAWVAIKTLHETGCNLPVEIWYKGTELNEDCIEVLEKEKNIVCKNIEDYNTNNLRGWMLKPFAIIHSSFKEVLFIDADNIVLKNPEYLFDFNEYKDTGSLFWPDFWKTAENNPIWRIINIPYTKSNEQESGQILINKEKCWECLNLCAYFNYKAEVYYKLLLGDKDTFRFAWLALNRPFYMIEREPDTCGYIDSNSNFMGVSMIQYDMENVPLFIHRNLVKWDITAKNELVWQKIKRFRKGALIKKYINAYSKTNGHYFMDFSGDYSILNFEDEFGNIEEKCINSLNLLRSMRMYANLLLNYYIQNDRIKCE